MKKILIFALGILFCISVIGNSALAYSLYMHSQREHIAGEHSSTDVYSYLSPRIFASNQNDLIVNFIDLRRQLKSYIEPLGETVGMYFEYLPSGTSIGINEKQEFALASLLKVPLVMGVYKKIESGELKKDDILILTKENIDSQFGDLWKKGAGTPLTIDEAIHLTLIKSDNTAKSALFTATPIGTIDHVFDYLDIPKDIGKTAAYVTPKNYSSVLRSLYLSSYLSYASSNEILDLLTQSPFNDRIAAGIPEGVKIAHKIGEYISTDATPSTYTDCGIIYEPHRPYILCVMANTDKTSAKQYMKEISKIIYDYVSTTTLTPTK